MIDKPGGKDEMHPVMVICQEVVGVRPKIEFQKEQKLFWNDPQVPIQRYQVLHQCKELLIQLCFASGTGVISGI